MLNYSIVPTFPVGLYMAALDKKIFEDALPTLRIKIDEATYQKDMVVHSVSDFDRYLLEMPELAELKSHLEEHVAEYVDKVMGEKTNRFKLYITMSWCTGLLPGNTHQEHNHANSIISGVMYFDNPPDASPLVLHKDDSSASGFINLSPSNVNEYSRNMMFIPPQNGSLLIFPSQLKHRVPQNTTQQRRCSLAFDTFVEGEFGASRNRVVLSRVPQK